MKKSYKKEDWYKGRCDEIFKLMKWENHKDHVGFDWLKKEYTLTIYRNTRITVRCL